MYTIIDGKKLAQKIRLELKTEAEKFKIQYIMKLQNNINKKWKGRYVRYI